MGRALAPERFTDRVALVVLGKEVEKGDRAKENSSASGPRKNDTA